MKNSEDFDYEELKKNKDPWGYIEKQAIEITAKSINVPEAKVRLSLEQSKQVNALGYALKLARQKKRISVTKMAEIMKTDKEGIKIIESEKITNCPLGLITAYLNQLDRILSFNIEDFNKGEMVNEA
jgi:ribosome-binding protein aMBF1 (putative translation factor)